MKIVFPITALLIFISSPLLGVDVEPPINVVSKQPRAYSLHAEEAAKLLKIAPAKDTVIALLNVIDADTLGVRSEAATRLMLALDPFPINELDDAAISEINHRNRAYALWFLNRGVKSPADIEKVVAHAKGMLNEEREAFRTYGEAKAIAPLGLRGADAGYNILVQRLNLTEKFPLISVSDTMLPERNELIDKLCIHLSLPVHKWTELRPRDEQASTSGKQMSGKAPINSTTSNADSVTDLPQPSLSWFIWSAVSALIIGLLWLVIKRKA